MQFRQLREQTIIETKQKIKQSVGEDTLIIQAATTLETLTTVTNTLIEKLRMWCELYNPEFSHETKDNKTFVDAIANTKTTQKKETMGGKLEEKDITAIQNFAKTIQQISATQQEILKYAETKLKNNCKNILEILETTLTAKLLILAGSLKNLAMMPASTIQLLGAQKALFKHLKEGAKTPKYGILATHPLVEKASAKNKGKTARILASKIAIAAKVYYFKGSFIFDQLKKEIKQKIP
ncbi:hypothetical protein HY485_01780 [Candidatus Woesearchaeota archaeon]|nr:hypothetical protein [Candidatus Woesearchaeota archaeon]